MGNRVCKAWDDPAGERANPECVCDTVAKALACATGHLMECHYPKSCEAARCRHWSWNQSRGVPAIHNMMIELAREEDLLAAFLNSQ